MKLKKRIMIGILSFCMAMGFCACGAKEEEEIDSELAMIDMSNVGNASDFYGIWAYEGVTEFLIVIDEEGWHNTDASGEEKGGGTWTAEDDSLTLKEEGIGYVTTLTFTEDGRLQDTEGDYLLPAEFGQLSAEGQAPAAHTSRFVGVWRYDDLKKWIVLEDDLTYGVYDDLEGEALVSGSYEIDEDTISLYVEKDGKLTVYNLCRLNVDGGLVDQDGEFIHMDVIE